VKIMVTGGCGFIGSHLVEKLLVEGHDVSVMDNLSTGSEANKHSEARYYICDIRSGEAEKIITEENPSVIYHLAAQINVRKSEEDPFFDVDVNINGSVNIVKSFLKAPAAKKIIFSSTGGVMYGETDILPTPESVEPFPLCPYGISKLTVEKYLNYFSRFYGLDFVALRYGNVYGPGQNPASEAGVVAIFSSKILKGEQPVIFGDGTQTRDYVFIDDVTRANYIALKDDIKGIFNVGSGKETNVNQIFEYVRECAGVDIERIYGDERKGEIKRSSLASEKIKRVFNWNPEIDIQEGIKRTFEFFKNKKSRVF
jgi:UDP-glucose 4-epimerase